MKLSKILKRDLERPINAAVVVSNRKEETINAEIEEYIFTNDLIEKLYLFIDTILNKKQGKTGVWINGYYGSGKSHFIKFAHYCLNPNTSEKAMNHFIANVETYQDRNDFPDVTVSKVKQLQHVLNQTLVQDIIFNVEDETDDVEGERLTRIFLSMLNRFRGYNSSDIPLAILFEKYLDKKGKLKEFSEKLETEFGFDWNSQAAEVASYELDTILELAKNLVPEIDTESLKSKLSNPETFRITIKDTLIPELKDFLSNKENNYRLVFLVDEVSQYIGKNKELLLNFQNIIERVSEDCNNQVWIACTAQQSLDEVSESVGAYDVNDEFGKILGRFDTRISLESADASYITQMRVLEKNAKGEKALGELYRSNQDAIENQFKIQHDLYKGFTNPDDLILSYPFVPYQFKLISHVFESFQGLKFVIKEVKDNERSILSITHFTSRENKDLEVGSFMAFDAFFNDQLKANLTQRGRRAIENALNLSYVKKNDFAQRVVKNLFMVSNLKDSVRITFQPNIDNLTILMMTNLDENRLQLQKEIREVLEQLIKESIIREEKGNYFFFNEDEMELTNLIKDTAINNEDRLNAADEIIRNQLRISRKERYENNDFTLAYNLDGKFFFNKGDLSVFVTLFEPQQAHQLALGNNSNQLVICINEWFAKEKPLRNDFEWFVKTNKYLNNNNQTITGEREKTINNFRQRNNDLYHKITNQFIDRFEETNFISGPTVIEAASVRGNSPAERYKNALTMHFSIVYKHHKLANAYATTAADLRKAVHNTQITTNNDLTPAEQMVEDYIMQMGGTLTVTDIVQKFQETPCGWKDVAVIHIIAELNKKKKRELEFKNQPRYKRSDFIEKALNTNDRMSCVVKEGEEIPQSLIEQTLLNYRNIFNKDLKATTDGNLLFESIVQGLQKELDTFIDDQDQFYGNYPFGTHHYKLCQRLEEWKNIRDPKRLFDILDSEQNEAKELYDRCKALKDFTGRAITQYKTIQTFYDANKENFNTLPDDDQNKVEMLSDFFKSDNPAPLFRHVRKAYDELKSSINSLCNELIEKAVMTYNQLFDELDAEAKKLGVTDAHVYGDRNFNIRRIEKLKSITQLQLELSKAGNFKSDQLKVIVDAAAKQNTKPNQPKAEKVGEPQEFYVSKLATVIRNEKELEAYLQKAKAEMLELLKQNKTIIIK